MTIINKKNIGLFAVLVLGFLPVLRWFFFKPLSLRFENIYIAFTSLGQITGLFGMSLFAINLILSSRLKILDKLFNGLPDVYETHQKIGQLAFVVLLFHPLLLAFRYFQFSIKSVIIFLLPQSFEAQTFGTIALFLMIIFISLTLYAKLKYQNWKISHKFMILVFVFAVFHTFLIGSDISRDIFIKYYIFILSIAGLLLSSYNSFLSMFLRKDFEYKVKSVENLNNQIVKITAEPASKKLNFNPGQFVFVKFFSKAVSRESHPFTISSSPSEKNLEFVVKNLGDFTSNLKNLGIGDKILINGPFGKFFFENKKNKNQIWLAGGVGITPFLSMARHLNNKNINYKIDLYYCVKNENEAVLLKEFLEIAQKNKNFKVINWYSDDNGLITAETILKLSRDLLSKDFFICGPESFMIKLKTQLKSLEIKEEDIYWEKFSFN